MNQMDPGLSSDVILSEPDVELSIKLLGYLTPGHKGELLGSFLAVNCFDVTDTSSKS